MKKFQLFSLLAIPFILLTGFKKNIQQQSFHSAKSINTSGARSSAELPEVLIADATTIQGDKGQEPFKMLVCLSKASLEPVTIEYSTEDGTAKAGADYVATNGSIRFEPGEIAKWITISIIGKVAADPDEDAPPPSMVALHIKIQKVFGAIARAQSITINIIKDILRDPQFNKYKYHNSAYLVTFDYFGYTSLGGDLTNCHVRRNGEVFMTGVLYGDENVGRYEPVIYRGHTWMGIDMDICSVERDEQKDPPDQFCNMSVGAFGGVTVELTLDTSAHEGYGYIQIHYDPTKDRSWSNKTVVGSCFSQLGGELQNIPDNSIASVFNGRELPMLIDRSSGYPKPLRTLIEGETYSQTDKEGNTTVIKVEQKLW